MGLIRLVLLVLLLWVVWLLIRRTLAALRPPQRRNPEEAQRMVRCLRCGVHVPEQHALWHEDRTFCSREHQHAWFREHG